MGMMCIHMFPVSESLLMLCQETVVMGMMCTHMFPVSESL